MKKVLFLSIILGIFMNLHASFLDEQKKYKRVRVVLEEKYSAVEEILNKNSLHAQNLNVLFIAFKDEEMLELWAKNSNEENYKYIKNFKICASSGGLGPKSKQGDYQVPEGFYYIDRFNPVSNFYLSLGINYPNTADKKRSNAANLGGDIFIHGNCVSIGCLAMRDEQIKEIYLYALYAKNSGQNKIPVYIFPFKMNDENLKEFWRKYKNGKNLLLFWENLSFGYEKFISTKKELKYKYNNLGGYVF